MRGDTRVTSKPAAAGDPLVHLFPLASVDGVRGSVIFDTLHAEQTRHSVQNLWDPSLRVNKETLEYLCTVCQDHPPEVRQGAVLLLKRYLWHILSAESPEPAATIPVQVVALTCANLSLKHWTRSGIAEQKLHWLSRNAYTREDFIAAEMDVLNLLEGVVYWSGSLLAEWIKMLLHAVSPLLASANRDASTLDAVAAHVSDMLVFEDELMATYLPSELAAATLQTSVLICTKSFQRSPFLLRVAHLCRITEERMLQLSEKLLCICLGKSQAEGLLEGNEVQQEDSELMSDDSDASGLTPPTRKRRSGVGTSTAIVPVRSVNRRHS